VLTSCSRIFVQRSPCWSNVLSTTGHRLLCLRDELCIPTWTCIQVGAFEVEVVLNLPGSFTVPSARNTAW